MTGYFASTYKSEHTYPDELPCKSPNYEKDSEGRCIMTCIHALTVREIDYGSGWEHVFDGTECD